MVKRQINGILEFTKTSFTVVYLLSSAIGSFTIGTLMLAFIVLPAGLFGLACFAMAADAMFGTDLLALLS